jgi:DNA replication licensing factor MCM2
MNDKDRVSIHEAMEQQSISISKAGIITSLKARCSVIAAANPVQGRYNSSQTFSENVELSDAILSRFDCLAVVRDTVDIDIDSKLGSFVIESHMKAHPQYSDDNKNNNSNSKDKPTDNSNSNTNSSSSSNKNITQINQDILRKYIIYAREHCHPKLNNMDDDKIARLYADLRRESAITGGIPIAVRHIESMIRMSEAHAKIHLRDSVNEVDVNMAIRVMLESFISTQKFSVMRRLQKHFDKYLTFNRDTHELLLFTLTKLMNEAVQMQLLRRNNNNPSGNINFSQIPVEVGLDQFENAAEELEIVNLDSFYKSDVFLNSGFMLDKHKKNIIKQLIQ